MTLPAWVGGWAGGRTYLVLILQVEPAIEGLQRKVKYGKLQLHHARADIPLVLINAENRKPQALLLQGSRVQGDGELLVEEDGGVGVPLDLQRERAVEGTSKVGGVAARALYPWQGESTGWSLVPRLESWLCCPHNLNANPSFGGSAVMV